jgi:hypothetical protein
MLKRIKIYYKSVFKKVARNNNKYNAWYFQDTGNVADSEIPRNADTAADKSEKQD